MSESLTRGAWGCLKCIDSFCRNLRQEKLASGTLLLVRRRRAKRVRPHHSSDFIAPGILSGPHLLTHCTNVVAARRLVFIVVVDDVLGDTLRKAQVFFNDSASVSSTVVQLQFFRRKFASLNHLVAHGHKGTSHRPPQEVVAASACREEIRAGAALHLRLDQPHSQRSQRHIVGLPLFLGQMFRNNPGGLRQIDMLPLRASNINGPLECHQIEQRRKRDTDPRVLTGGACDVRMPDFGK